MQKTMWKRPAGAHRPGRALAPQQRLILAAVRAFLFGVGASLLLLAAGAAAFAALPLPGAAVRPAACLIAGVGAAVSGAALAAGIGRQRLLCGLCSGVFYLLCLAAASAMAGRQVLVHSNLALGATLLCAGLFGGVVTALRPAQRSR